MMNIKEFEKKLLIYGSDLNRWEGLHVEMLRAFIASNDKARDMYIEAQALDMQLDDFTVAEASAEIALAAMAEIKRGDAVQAQLAPPRRSLGLLISDVLAGIMRPAFAYSMVAVFVAIGVIALLNQPAGDKAQGRIGIKQERFVQLAANEIDGFLDEFNAMEDEMALQDELLTEFASIEAVDEFIDGYDDNLDLDETEPEDIWEYFYSRG